MVEMLVWCEVWVFVGLMGEVWGGVEFGVEC